MQRRDRWPPARSRARSLRHEFPVRDDGPAPGPVSSSDCFHGWTAGHWAASVPTIDGDPVELAGPFGGAWAGLAWRADGRLGDREVVALGETRGDPEHTEENCVTTAFEHFIDTGQLNIR